MSTISLPRTESTTISSWKHYFRVEPYYTVATIEPVEPPLNKTDLEQASVDVFFPQGTEVGELLEDLWDIESVRRAIADPSNQARIPWALVKKSLNL